MSDGGLFWDDIDGGAPPLSPDELREWEEREGVRLPAGLARVLMIQDGGCVRGTENLLWIGPLSRFESLALPQYEYLSGFEAHQELGDLGRMFFFGNHESSRLVLDYNVGEEPRVLWFDEDELRVEDATSTFDDLIECLREPEG